MCCKAAHPLFDRRTWSNPRHEWNESLAETIAVVIYGHPSRPVHVLREAVPPAKHCIFFIFGHMSLGALDSLLLHSDWFYPEQPV
jgi:hypothetical protein